MRIFNITSIPTVQNSYVGSNKAERPILSNIPADSFTFKGTGLFPLKEITLNTAEKLYNTDYVPMSKPKKGYFLTYVLDKNTGSFVDIYVKKAYCRERCVNGHSAPIEKYSFYRKKSDGRLKLVGFVERTYDEVNKKVSSGYMETLDKSLSGLGIRAQQLMIEVMSQKGYKDVEIASAFEAYNFHYGCGFRHIDSYIKDSAGFKTGFLKFWQKILKTDINTINEMLVYNPNTKKAEINIIASMVNFAKYANKNDICVKDNELFIPMRLTKPALKEWLGLSKLKPILR